MLSKSHNLIPAQLRATQLPPGVTKDDARNWRDRLRDRMSGKEEKAPEARPDRIFNWTDTRGDRFAVCLARDIHEARRFVLRHAYVHLCELDAAERESLGRVIPTNKAARQAYYKRLEARAMAFARDVQLRELTREEYAAMCEEQRGALSP